MTLCIFSAQACAKSVYISKAACFQYDSRTMATTIILAYETNICKHYTVVSILICTDFSDLSINPALLDNTENLSV